MLADTAFIDPIVIMGQYHNNKHFSSFTFDPFVENPLYLNVVGFGGVSTSCQNMSICVNVQVM